MFGEGGRLRILHLLEVRAEGERNEFTKEKNKFLHLSALKFSPQKCLAEKNMVALNYSRTSSSHFEWPRLIIQSYGHSRWDVLQKK